VAKVSPIITGHGGVMVMIHSKGIEFVYDIVYADSM
jgi:hypothetical protein